MRFQHLAGYCEDGGVPQERAFCFGRKIPCDLGDEVPVQGAAREIAVHTRDLLRQICRGQDVVIVQGSVSPDHIHMLVSVAPQLAPAKLVPYRKGRSSRTLQDEFPQLKKRYWGQHLWARGYFCASVGAVDEDTIRRYIENQQWDDPGENFKITAPTEP